MTHSYSSFIVHLDEQFKINNQKTVNYSLGKIKKDIEKEFEEIYGDVEEDAFYLKDKYMYDTFEGAYRSLNPPKIKYKK